MSNKSSVPASGGIGFFGLLSIVLIVLKLIGKITLSWFWCIAPLWMPAVVIILLFVIGIIIAVILSS